MEDRKLCIVTSVHPDEGVFYARVESLGMVQEFDLEELADASVIGPGSRFVWATGRRDVGGSRERYSRLEVEAK